MSLQYKYHLNCRNPSLDQQTEQHPLENGISFVDDELSSGLFISPEHPLAHPSLVRKITVAANGMKTQTNPQKTNSPAQVSAFNYHMKNKLRTTHRGAEFQHCAIDAAHRSSTRLPVFFLLII